MDGPKRLERIGKTAGNGAKKREKRVHVVLSMNAFLSQIHERRRLMRTLTLLPDLYPHFWVL
jgi:hypothetical protein